MSNRRTSPWVAQLRFFALCSPAALILGWILWPWIIQIMLGFIGTLWFVWQFNRFTTNVIVRAIDPEGYESLKRRGVDPFTNELGIPLNFDSDEVRYQEEDKHESGENHN